MNEERTISCRAARRAFGTETPDRARTKRHLASCQRCAQEYRLFELSRAALDLAAVREPVRPQEDFFVALRARINRGPQETIRPAADQSWTAALWLTARQLIPAMAVLLLLIIGMTLFFDTSTPNGNTMVSNSIDDYPDPTPDDIFESLVAVEEKENGR
jgi:hypothetical protein